MVDVTSLVSGVLELLQAITSVLHALLVINRENDLV